MKILKALIIDDEQPARDELKYLLKDYNFIQIIGESENGLEALKKAEELQPEVIFLDINIPKINGCEVAKNLSNFSKPPYIVFITAYDMHALEAFEIGAVDYLLKPISQQRLYKSLEKIKQFFISFNENKNTFENKLEKLAVEKNGRIKLINIKEIIFAKAYSGDTIIKTKNDTFTYKGTIKNLKEILNQENFFRAQKSYIVNINEIIEIIPWFKGTYWIIMNDEIKTQISVSKNQIKNLKHIVGLCKDN
ncbi:MAG: LytR/AlgR family response regulator transcription factor [Thermoanaerobacteraceae bacterium]